MSTATLSSEQLADYFMKYLVENYSDSRHVRRVATWVGFILKAIERASGGNFSLNRSRQIHFEYRGHTFKAKYHHHAGVKGGIQIIEVLPSQGSPEGAKAMSITNLDEAEVAYQSLEQRLDAVI